MGRILLFDKDLMIYSLEDDIVFAAKELFGFAYHPKTIMPLFVLDVLNFLDLLEEYPKSRRSRKAADTLIKRKRQIDKLTGRPFRVGIVR